MAHHCVGDVMEETGRVVAFDTCCDPYRAAITGCGARRVEDGRDTCATGLADDTLGLQPDGEHHCTFEVPDLAAVAYDVGIFPL